MTGRTDGLGREAALTAGAGLLVVACCLALLAWDAHFFWHDDCQIAAVPVWFDVHRALLAGEWPLLSPYCWHAPSLAGEFQAGVFSPVVLPAMAGAVALGLDMKGTAAAFATFMLAVTAMGAFRVGRGEGLPAELALLVAIVAAFNGWSVTWAASDWMPAASGFAMLVWAWWAQAEAVRPGAPPWRALVAGLTVFLLITVGWPLTIVMGAMIGAWLFAREATRVRGLWPAAPLAAAWTIGLGLAAPAWLTFLEYLGATARASAGTALQWEWLVPLAALPGLAVPAVVTTWKTFGVDKLHVPLELANGLAPTAALLAALAGARRVSLAPLAWPLALTALLLALSCLPSVGMFRWSFRWLPLFHTVAALTAALWLARRLAAGPTGRWQDNPGIWAVLAVAVAAPLALRLPVLPPTIVWVYAAIAVVWALIEHRSAPLAPLRRAAPVLVALAAFGATYLLIPNGLGVPDWRITEALRRPEPLERGVRYMAIAVQADYFRYGVESETWGTLIRPGNTPMLAGLTFINGYTALAPLGPRMGLLMNVHGYLDPLAIEPIVVRGAAPNGLLARLGVDGLVVGATLREKLARTLRAHGWQPGVSAAEASVYRRPGPPSPAVRTFDAARAADLRDLDAWWAAIYHEDGLAAVPASPSRPAGTIARFGPRPLRLVADERHVARVEVGPGDRPALVAIARAWSPGWQATLAGRGIEVVAVDGMLLGCEVPAGAHGLIELRYAPAGVRLGGLVALLTAAVTLGGLLALGRRRRLQPADQPPAQIDAG